MNAFAIFAPAQSCDPLGPKSHTMPPTTRTTLETGRHTMGELLGDKTLTPEEGCSECQRMWQRYVEATMRQIRIDAQRRVAQIRGDVSAVAGIGSAAVIAEQDRSTARAELITHKCLAHA